MPNLDSPSPSSTDATAGSPAPSDSAEFDRLAHALSVRFASHLEAAEARVRAAEHELAQVHEQLQRAHEEAAQRHYRSDPLVFMRESVKDEVDAVGRKTTPKKVRAAYRYLVDRALELADGEVRGFEADEAAAARERTEGVQACLLAEQVAAGKVTAAQAMRDRVKQAEQRALDGLALMVAKLAAEGETP